MVEIKTDNELIRSCLERLVCLVLKNGGYIDPGLQIVSEKNELKILSSFQKEDKRKIIYLPNCCLPRIQDFHVRLSDDELHATPKTDRVTLLHAELFSTMLDLYNLTEKISVHRATFPCLAFLHSSAILEQLFRGRSVSDNYQELVRSAQFDLLVIESFFGTRYVNHDYCDGQGQSKTLMPIIDFLNHDSLATGYFRVTGHPDPGREKGLMVRNFKSNESDNECLVRYTKADAFGAYMSYGFVDYSAFVLRSIPLTIDLPGGRRIRVYSYTYSQDSAHIPGAFHDIGYCFPNIVYTGKKELQVSHLMVPGVGQMKALRRILKFLVSTLFPGLSKKYIKKYVILCEREVISANTRYYDDLLRAVMALPEDQSGGASVLNLKAMIGVQQRKLSKYISSV